MVTLATITGLSSVVVIHAAGFGRIDDAIDPASTSWIEPTASFVPRLMNATVPRGVRLICSSASALRIATLLCARRGTPAAIDTPTPRLSPRMIPGAACAVENAARTAAAQQAEETMRKKPAAGLIPVDSIICTLASREI